MQQQTTERTTDKPATVRIESKMVMALDVPLPGPGRTFRGFVRIPAATANEKGELVPGVVESNELDGVTLNRLRYHYDWRPTDPKLFGKQRGELAPEQITEIGLLKITVLKDKPAEGKKAA